MTSTEAPKLTCPTCGGQESRVLKTRHRVVVEGIRRRRQCADCHGRYTTIEKVVVEADAPTAVPVWPTREALASSSN